ncbi:hypothetical protein MTO96_026631 [Rhipicephalus appendiculatus]
MGHPNPLDFFATQFLVLPWILMLLQNSDQPTGFPLSSGAGHLPVNVSLRHDGLRQPGLYCALKADAFFSRSKYLELGRRCNGDVHGPFSATSSCDTPRHASLSLVARTPSALDAELSARIELQERSRTSVDDWLRELSSPDRAQPTPLIEMENDLRKRREEKAAARGPTAAVVAAPTTTTLSCSPALEERAATSDSSHADGEASGSTVALPPEAATTSPATEPAAKPPAATATTEDESAGLEATTELMDDGSATPPPLGGLPEGASFILQGVSKPAAPAPRASHRPPPAAAPTSTSVSQPAAHGPAASAMVSSARPTTPAAPAVVLPAAVPVPPGLAVSTEAVNHIVQTVLMAMQFACAQVSTAHPLHAIYQQAVASLAPTAQHG